MDLFWGLCGDDQHVQTARLTRTRSPERSSLCAVMWDDGERREKNGNVRQKNLQEPLGEAPGSEANLPGVHYPPLWWLSPVRNTRV